MAQEYDIHESLVRLEKNLSDLQSAREQVEKTVTSSNALKDIVVEYTNSLTIVIEEISHWKKELEKFNNVNASEAKNITDFVQSVCNNITDDFSLKIDTAKNTFYSDIKGITQSFNEQFTQFSVSCNTVVKNIDTSLKSNTDTFKEEVLKVIENFSDENIKLAKTAEDIKNFKTQQEVAFTKIHTYNQEILAANTIITEKLNTTHKAISNTSQEIHQLKATQETEIQKVVSHIDNYSKEVLKAQEAESQKVVSLIGDLSKEFSVANQAINNKLNMINEAVIETTKSVKEQNQKHFDELLKNQKTLTKENNNNRLILIIGIVVIVVLQIVVLLFKK
ncbi:hypothetical protein [Capnocytophaga bilenii]